jgi:hypothetical protein
MAKKRRMLHKSRAPGPYQVDGCLFVLLMCCLVMTECGCFIYSACSNKITSKQTKQSSTGPATGKETEATVQAAGASAVSGWSLFYVFVCVCSWLMYFNMQ